MNRFLQITIHMINNPRFRRGFVFPVLVLILLFNSPSYPEEKKQFFRFQLETGDILTVEKRQNIQTKSVNGKNSKEEKNRILLKVVDTNGSLSTLEGSFLTYSRSPAGRGPFRRDRDFHSRFMIQSDGRYIVPDRFIMPNLRGLPTFPDHPLTVGEQWRMDGMETMDFGEVKLKIPVKVNYTYVERSNPVDVLESPAFPLPGPPQQFSRIDFQYEYIQNVKDRRLPIRSIGAKSKAVLFFDNDAGIPLFDRQAIFYTFLYEDGQKEEYLFSIDTLYKKEKTITTKQKEKMLNSVRENTITDKNITVRDSENGVLMELNDILFQYNSAELSDRANSTIARIAEILKKQPGREIRISGHTDSRGSSEYNQTLSEKRAKAVADALVSGYGLDGHRLSYRGEGEKSPRASNDSDEGRAENRRVEILIVTD